jgi:hypothetical protein
VLYALILVTVAFLVTLILLVKGKGASEAATASLAGEPDRARLLEGDLEKRKKELEDNRRQLSELKDELKQSKRKLYEQKEADRELRELQKARVDHDRNATAQLELVRAELAHAQVELDRLKGEGQVRARRPDHLSVVPPTPAPVQPASAPSAEAPPATQAAPALAPAPEEKPRRVIRELNDADKERMNRLESDARRERARATELERDLKRVKSKADTQNRLFVVMKGELELVKDRYKALEKRMNRTLLQNDLVRRAIKDLEKKTGISAGRTELTEDELQASDRLVEDRSLAEAKQAEERARAASEADRMLEASANAEAQPPAASEAPPASPAPAAATDASATEALPSDAGPAGAEPSAPAEDKRAEEGGVPQA